MDMSNLLLQWVLGGVFLNAQNGETKTTRIMMATVRHVTSSSGL
jgi:hypothetical protein